MNDEKTVVITGGAGVIGSHLAHLLINSGYKIIIIDNLFSGNIDNLPKSKNIYYFKKDVRDMSIESIYNQHKPSILFHLAAHYANDLSIKDPLFDLDVNTGGTLTQLELAHKTGIKKFVYASTSCVYAPSEIPLKEDSPIKPHTPYGISKLAGEYYCDFYNKNYGLETAIVRYFNCYGPKEDTNMYRGVVPRFIDRIINGLSINITGDGKEIRDFTYVEDAVRATLLVALYKSDKNEIFNIGTGVPTTILDLANKLMSLYGGNVPIKFTDRRFWDKTVTRIADIEKAKNVLGFNPTYSILAGLSKTLDWYKNKM